MFVTAITIACTWAVATAFTSYIAVSVMRSGRKEAWEVV